MVVEILLAVVVALLLFLVYLVHKGGRIETRDIENAVSKAWRDSGLDKKVGELTVHANDMKEAHRSIEQMLQVPKGKADFGELSLETILSDQLPDNMFGIRKEVLGGKKPDAHINSSVGTICIDSKFPLKNYKNMVDAKTLQEKKKFKRKFVKDVRGNLDKICTDYVCPDKGSAEFAFAYIPSEAVYYFLVCEAYDVLRAYTRKGVQVVSPLTLSHKIELIKAGVHAKKLSEEAQKVKDDIIRLSRRFEKINENWRVFYGTHMRKAIDKGKDLDQSYRALKGEFDRITKSY